MILKENENQKKLESNKEKKQKVSKNIKEDNKKELKESKEKKHKQAKEKKVKNEKSLKKVKNREKKFITSIKKRWLINKTNTILLVVILIALFILINSAVKYFDPAPIDCTTSQDFSLTDESKERVKTVDKEVNIYFVGWGEADPDYILAKQYHNANSKINVEIIDATENLEIANKYNVTNDDYVIIVECGEVSRTLYYYDDILSYDANYNTVDLAEQKITSAILNITSNEIPKAYFLTGYTQFNFTTSGGLSIFAQYLGDEVLEYEELNILNKQKVPDDCDTLIIMTPDNDFDEMTANAIIDYIEKGGNILWLNGAYIENKDLKNVNKILAQYGVDKFDVGYVYETDINNTLLDSPSCFIPEIQDTDVTKNIYDSIGTVFFIPTKININEDKLEDLNVERTDLVLSSDNTYFTTDTQGNMDKSKDEKGGFVLGTQLTKTISSENEENTENEDTETVDSEVSGDNSIKSTLIIFGNDYFITDLQLASNVNPMALMPNNVDLALNSIAYLTDNDVNITIRKSYSDSQTTFNPTDGDKALIMKIIFIVPVVIIAVGIIVWVLRKRRQ